MKGVRVIFLVKQMTEFRAFLTPAGNEMVFTTNDSSKSATLIRFGRKFIEHEVTVPDTIDGYSVKIIENGVFKKCAFLTKVILPESVTHINEGAFEGCTSLTKVVFRYVQYSTVFPKSLKNIGRHAFEGCTSLKNTGIPRAAGFDRKSSFHHSTSPGLQYEKQCCHERCEEFRTRRFAPKQSKKYPPHENRQPQPYHISFLTQPIEIELPKVKITGFSTTTS